MENWIPNRNVQKCLHVARALMALFSHRANDNVSDDVIAALSLVVGDSVNVAQILPPEQFHSVDDVERIANDLELAAGRGPGGTHDEMYGIFYELALNAVQHSQSAAGCYAILEHSMDADGGVTHILGVADCGIGILASLRQNPAFADVQNDADAIALATELHITGTGDQHRGLGLDYVMNVVKDWGGDFCILSGEGYLNVKDGTETTGGNLNSRERISGTVVVVTLRVPATMR